MVHACDTSCHGVLFKNSEHKVKHMHRSTWRNSVSKITTIAIIIHNSNTMTITATTIIPQLKISRFAILTEGSGWHQYDKLTNLIRRKLKCISACWSYFIIKCIYSKDNTMTLSSWSCVIISALDLFLWHSSCTVTPSKAAGHVRSLPRDAPHWLRYITPRALVTVPLTPGESINQGVRAGKRRSTCSLIQHLLSGGLFATFALEGHR